MVFDDAALDGGFIASIGFSLGRTAAQELGSQMGAPPNSPSGLGCAVIRLGNAGGVGCGGIRGLDLGLDIYTGTSTVISSSIESCTDGEN